MRKLLLFALASAFPLTASAQWASQGAFPEDTLNAGSLGQHGIAVDPDGQVYIQPFAATTTVSAPAGDVSSRQIFIYEADGTPADTLTFLTNEDGTPGDTLGGFTFRDGSGALDWEGKSGRGLATGEDGNIFVSQFNFLYELDYQTNRVLNQVELPSSLPSSALTAPSIANDGTIYVRAVFPGESVMAFSDDFTPLGNVVETSNFARTILVSPDGNTLFLTDYENPFTIVYQRPDEFSAFDSLGVTMRGMRVESVAINPATGNYWFSSGNATDNPLNQDPEATRTWYSHTWYAFDPDELVTGGATNENPAPADSLTWYECEFPDEDDAGTTDRDERFLCHNEGSPLPGKPRGIAFSPDGDTAYVILFSQTNAVARYTRMDVATENRPEAFAGSLEQNAPNPFSGTTTFRFSLDDAAHVTLRVFDTAGRQVATVLDGVRAAGPQDVEFDAGDLAAGVYVYSLDIEGQVQSRRMMIVR